MSIYARFGVETVINACGTVTRLSGGRMHPDVAAAMLAASTECVDMVALQAGACRVITRATGAQAGIVTAGASAGVLLDANRRRVGQAGTGKRHGRRERRRPCR